MAFVIFPQGEGHTNKQMLDTFAEMIGEENYKEFTSEYNIIFMDSIPFAKDETYGDINTYFKQVRIKNSAEKKMLISLCHEYGHYLCIKNDLANNEYYQELFEQHNPIWYGNCNITSYAYSSIDEFIASYLGAEYYNAGVNK